MKRLPGFSLGFGRLQALIGMNSSVYEGSTLGANPKFEECLKREAMSGSGAIAVLETNRFNRSDDRLYECVQKVARLYKISIYYVPASKSDLQAFVIKNNISFIVAEMSMATRLATIYRSVFERHKVHMFFEDEVETYVPQGLFIGTIESFYRENSRKYIACRLDSLLKNTDPEEEDICVDLFQDADRASLRSGKRFFYGAYEIGNNTHYRIKVVREYIWSKQDSRENARKAKILYNKFQFD